MRLKVPAAVLLLADHLDVRQLRLRGMTGEADLDSKVNV